MKHFYTITMTPEEYGRLLVMVTRYVNDLNKELLRAKEMPLQLEQDLRASLAEATEVMKGLARPDVMGGVG